MYIYKEQPLYPFTPSSQNWRCWVAHRINRRTAKLPNKTLQTGRHQRKLAASTIVKVRAQDSLPKRPLSPPPGH